MRRVEIETQAPFSDKPRFVRKNAPTSNGAGVQSSISAEIQLPPRNQPTGEQIALAQSLTAALQSRLASDESNLWKFNLGIDLAKTFQAARNPDEAQRAAQILRQSAENAPNGISAESLAALRKLIAILESNERTLKPSSEIVQALAIIFKSK